VFTDPHQQEDGVKFRGIFLLALLAVAFLAFPGNAAAQEGKFTVNGYVQMQGGIFVPLTSQLFQDYDNKAFIELSNGELDTNRPCDPVNTPAKPCVPVDHGSKAGKASMLRGTINLMAEYRPEENITVHAVVRLIGSLKLEVDKYAQAPMFPDGADRRDYAQDWSWRNYYNEADLREFYVDLNVTEWLSLRLGKQQVVWGDINSYRLLDVVNPQNTAWHFGPLESFEDTRVPMWMVKAMFEMSAINHSLELLWVPMIGDTRDTVDVPLTLVGAWGLPYTNTPSPYIIREKHFLYPGNNFEDMRAGLRWRGAITPQSSYSLVYFYTHSFSPPIPRTGEFDINEDGYINNAVMDRLYLDFPRMHIAGFGVDYSFDAPISLVAKLEASVEPNRPFPQVSGFVNTTNEFDNGVKRVLFPDHRRLAVNYAVQLFRPTMVRWLNPTSNIIFLAQWSHTILPTLSAEDKELLVWVPGYNDYKLTTNSYTGIFAMATSYLHGAIQPKVVFAYIHPLSGFISTEVNFALGRSWRFRVQLTDFFGDDPYKAIGFFRDRDELNLAIRYQF
jgi:hypothetical protein